MVKIYFLGIGGWDSHRVLGHTSILIEFRPDLRFLVDAGEGTYFALKECTCFDVKNIEYIILTHRHGDHILGMATISQFVKFKGVRPTVICNEDVLNALKELFNAVGVPKHFDLFNFKVIDPPTELLIKDVKLRFIKAKHPLPSFSVRFDYGGKCVVISGDTAPNEELMNLARECDVLIHEVSTNDYRREEAHTIGHSSVSDALNIAKKTSVKYLVPLHFPEEPIIFSNADGVNIVFPYRCMCLKL